MQWGFLALAISFVAVLYFLVLFYVLTRTIWRTFRDKPAPPVKLEIKIADLDRHLNKKIA